MNLHLDKTIRRNLRKTPDERVETLMAALREVQARGQWPKAERSTGCATRRDVVVAATDPRQ